MHDELIAAGYGYSVLHELLGDDEFDLDAFIEMCSDWGWAGTRRR